jgi:hypothetical protein
MEQKCQRRDEDVRLHAIVGAVIDRPQVDDILEIGEGALDPSPSASSAVSIEDRRLPPSGLGEIAALLTRACSSRDSSRCLISSIAERVSSGSARSTWM